MNDLEIRQRAKMYIDKLANGINPLDDTILPESDIVNNVRISRCLFYVSEVLRESMTVKKQKRSFYTSVEDLREFLFSDKPITVSEIVRRINAIAKKDNMKRITGRNISNWLVSIRLLYEYINVYGKKIKLPTEEGRRIGITTDFRRSYTVVLYNRSAQKFIIDNIDLIITAMCK